jgi:hypothetical protein
VADGDGPPVNATIEYDASIYGSVEVDSLVEQSIDPTNGYYGDINYFIANSGAGVDYSVDANGPIGYGYVTVGGGTTNGLPNSASGVGADSSSDPVVDVTSYDLEHDSDAHNEWWIYLENIEFTVNLSDSYGVDANSVSANPQLDASAYADLDFNISPTPSTYVYGDAMGGCDINASIAYTVIPNY